MTLEELYKLNEEYEGAKTIWQARRDALNKAEAAVKVAGRALQKGIKAAAKAGIPEEQVRDIILAHDEYVQSFERRVSA